MTGESESERVTIVPLAKRIQGYHTLRDYFAWSKDPGKHSFERVGGGFASKTPDGEVTMETVATRAHLVATMDNEEINQIFGPMIVFFASLYPVYESSAGLELHALGDIYRDLKEGLLAWDTGDPQAQRDAVWQWRFGLQSHWGRHLAAALRVIHFLRHVHFVELT